MACKKQKQFYKFYKGFPLDVVSARGKFVSGAKVFAAVPSISKPEISFQISCTEWLCGMTCTVETHFIISFIET